MSKQASPPPKNVAFDLVIPIMALAFTVYYLTTITEVPWIAQASAITVSMLLIAALIAYAVRTVLRIKAGRECVAFTTKNLRMPVEAKRIAMLVLSVAYVFVIDYAGFTITTFGFVFAGIILLSSMSNWRKALAISLSCSVLGYIVFIYFFETRFPRGPVENVLKALL